MILVIMQAHAMNLLGKDFTVVHVLGKFESA